MKIRSFNEFNSMDKYSLLTSNKNKLKEYEKYIPGIKPGNGIDLPEVDSDPITVALYKGVDNGSMTISEDTSLEVSGHEIGVNIKWLKHMLPKMSGEKATWRVLLVKNTGLEIRIYEGITEGIIGTENDKNGFSFDPFFYVDIDSEKLSLDVLKSSDKDPLLYSARAKASDNLMKDKPVFIKKISEIPEWTGKWQG